MPKFMENAGRNRICYGWNALRYVGILLQSQHKRLLPNPIPVPTNKNTQKQVERDIAVEKLRVRPQPAVRKTALAPRLWITRHAMRNPMLN
jgi:hypothetical protein